VALPQAILRKMKLRSGDSLKVIIEGDRIVLIPRKKRSRKGRIIKDPITGFPVLTAGPGAPKLTSEQVAEILADFP
jgi:bifunctional DNA-binding transcriptional regulator/antitoxin component of YhaV-PrlF toxin-antitoxin module